MDWRGDAEEARLLKYMGLCSMLLYLHFCLEFTESEKATRCYLLDGHDIIILIRP